MLSRLSPAKVNLFLRIIGKNTAGYHLLESLFVKLSCADRITVRLAPKIVVETRHSSGVAMDIADNTVTKAATLLQHKYSVSAGARITIDKQIPIGSGLGGASSNAATTLLLLSQLWDIAPTAEELHTLALSLGADVPFFLIPGNSMVYGIGEIIEPVMRLGAQYHLVLAYPGFAVPTKAVYQRSVSSYSPSLQSYSAANIKAQIEQGLNDLYATALALYPDLAAVITAIAAQPGCIQTRMSGSGSSCFGLFTNKAEAERAAVALGLSHPTWQLWAETLDI